MKERGSIKKQPSERLFLIVLSFLLVVLIVTAGYFIQEQRSTIFSLRTDLSALESKYFQSKKASAILSLRVGSLEEGMGNHVTTFNNRLSRFEGRLARQERESNDLHYRLEEVSSEVGSLTDKFLSSDVRAAVDLGNITVGRR
jgi:hypothetical protein